MGELKLKISDDVERRFREYALKRYGYKKGALSMAAEKALIEVVKRPNVNAREDLFLKSAGGWKDINAEALIKKIYESRSISTRKKVEFE
jgi:hypothetical protein